MGYILTKKKTNANIIQSAFHDLRNKNKPNNARKNTETNGWEYSYLRTKKKKRSNETVTIVFAHTDIIV